MSELPKQEQGVSISESEHRTPMPASNPALSHWQKQFGSKVIPFDELARCGDEVWIEHVGQIYRLRKTRHDKLVLSK